MEVSGARGGRAAVSLSVVVMVAGTGTRKAGHTCNGNCRRNNCDGKLIVTVTVAGTTAMESWW